MPIVGLIGVVICAASMLLLGMDITHMIKDGTLDITTVLDIMYRFTPDLWADVVNWINSKPANSGIAMGAGFLLSLSATLVGLLIGGLLVVIGFHMKHGKA